MPHSSQSRGGEVDRLVRACDPVAPEAFATPEIERVLDELGGAILARPRRANARRRRTWFSRPRGLLLVGAMVACLGGAATAAKFLTANTGQYPTKQWEIQAGGPGQYLRSWAPDFCRVALRVSADLRYPPGYESWRSYVLFVEDGIRRVSSTGPCASPKGAGETQSTGALHGWFAASAFCAWVWDWRKARLSNDQAAAAWAAQVIGSALHWNAIRAEDPHPKLSGGADFGQPSLFGWMLAYQTTVRAGIVGRIPQLANRSGGFGDCGMFYPGQQGGPRWIAAGPGVFEATR